jgi:WD40 repeat protein
VEAGDLSQADLLLEACPASLRRWEWHYLKRQCQPACQVLGGQSNEVLSLAASLDGRWLASLDKDGRMLLWDLKSDLTQPVQTWPPMIRTERFEDKLLVEQALAFSHDGHRLAYVRPVGKDEWALGVVSVGEVISERELLRASGEKLRPLCLSFSRGNRLIMVATSEGLIRSYDTSNGREGASYPILAAAFSPDGSRVVSTSVAVRRFDLEPPFEPVRNLRMFDTSTGRELLAITNLLESAALLSSLGDASINKESTWL